MKGRGMAVITHVWSWNIFIIVHTVLDIEWIGNVGLQAEIIDMDKDMVACGYRHSNINDHKLIDTILRYVLISQHYIQLYFIITYI